jgi:hypothetical protein
MNPLWYYPLHLCAFAAGVATLCLMERRRLPWAAQAVTGVLMCAAMAVFMFRISEPPDLFSDFYKAYYPAARAVVQKDGAAALAESMRHGAGGFVNLPILAYLFAPFGWLPPAAAGHLFFILGVLATIAAWQALSRLAGLDRARSLLLLFVFASCGPLHNSLREGNTTHFILLLLVLGLGLMRSGRGFTAGLLFGLAALVKLPLLLLGVYFFLTARWRVALGGACICAVAGLASLGVFGLDMHHHWHEHSIKPFAETPLAAFNVQSVQGFVARIQHGGRYLTDWTPHPQHPLARSASSLAVGLLVLAVALGIALSRRARNTRKAPATARDPADLEFCIVLMLAMMISTVSWSHYYLWLLLPAAFLIGGGTPALAPQAVRFSGWAALAAALPPVVLVHFANSKLASLHARLLVSHYLIAAGLLLGLFLFAICRDSLRKPDAPPR